jgi:hypothetical protein
MRRASKNLWLNTCHIFEKLQMRLQYQDKHPHAFHGKYALGRAPAG